MKTREEYNGIRYPKYYYQGKMYLIKELFMLPQCHVSLNTLKQRICQLGWSVERSLEKKNIHNTTTNAPLTATPINDKARIIAIMAKPINPKATSYYYVNCHDKETKHKIKDY